MSGEGGTQVSVPYLATQPRFPADASRRLEEFSLPLGQDGSTVFSHGLVLISRSVSLSLPVATLQGGLGSFLILPVQTWLSASMMTCRSRNRWAPQWQVSWERWLAPRSWTRLPTQRGMMLRRDEGYNHGRSRAGFRNDRARISPMCHAGTARSSRQGSRPSRQSEIATETICRGVQGDGDHPPARS